MKKAFTLAEVLITLGIIGVVAAITMPMLIGHYQKVVWYNQFKKAVSQLENAFKLYEVDNDCVGNIVDCINPDCENCSASLKAKDILPYFKVSQTITEENSEQICRVAVEKDEDYPCWTDNDHGIFGFITVDGLFVVSNLDVYFGGHGEFHIDINGPSKGPNKYGRDMFIFQAPYKNMGQINDSQYIIWAGSDKQEKYLGYKATCDEAGHYYGCAGKLLSEGKMNY